MATCHPDQRNHSRGLCVACHQRRWRSENPDKARATYRRSAANHRAADPAAHAQYKKERWLLENYGITRAERDAISEKQGGVCAICGGASELCVDHDHATGAVRGLLCRWCNPGLGLFRDNPAFLAAAIRYLEEAA